MRHNLTRSQRDNLGKLATYLESLPEDYVHFSMDIFIGDPLYDEKENDSVPEESTFTAYAKRNGGVSQFGCGTVACAIGHGPAAGVLFRYSREFDTESYRDESGTLIKVQSPDWPEYSTRFAPKDSILWNWLFGGDWDRHDNTHRGAAARIRFVLAGRDLPQEFDSIRWIDADVDISVYADLRLVPTGA